MENILFFLIIFRPFFRILSRWLGFLTDINSVGIIIIGFIILVCIKGIKPLEHLFFIYIVILTSISFISADMISLVIKDPYWLSIAILILVCCRREDIADKFIKFVKSKRKLIKCELIIINIILFISFFDMSCYEIRWGEGRYFASYLEGPHPLGFFLILVIAITLLLKIITRDKKINFLLILPSLAIMMTGARTVLITMVSLYLIFMRINVKSVMPWTVVLSGVIFSFWDRVIKIPIIYKFIAQKSSGDLSSGRFDFWLKDVESFFELNLLEKFIGGGFDYPYLVNYQMRGVYIWAHNDIINLLLSIGIIGLSIYLYFIFKLCKYIHKKERGINFVMFLIFLLGTMSLNGFYNYTDFVVSVFIVSASLFINTKSNLEVGIYD